MEERGDPNWRVSFFKDNFNVDQCLSKYTLKSDLETLRTDLKNYGNELHHQMAEILKTETEGIVNLAEYLTNLDSKIDDLSLPISQLREEIKILHDLIGSAQNSYFITLETLKANNNRQIQLNMKLEAVSSAMHINQMLTTGEDQLSKDLVSLDRAVTKYAFEDNYLKMSSSGISIDEISLVGDKLTQILNKVFLGSVKNCQKDTILLCLRMYDNLKRQNEAEQMYRVHIVRPVLKKLFNEAYLEKCEQDIDKIYNESLNLIDNNLEILQEILSANGELKSFNFVLNSFWLEVDTQSREGMPHITAPGNPELFQKRFKSTWNYLVTIAKKCGEDENLIVTNDTFRAHIKRFNLPVYFEIRFQQIAGQFESAAVEMPGVNCYLKDDNEICCKLKVTLALWKGIQRSFSSDVFIDNLAHQFLKLSMLLLARYLRWFKTALDEADSFTEGSNAWEDFIVSSLSDLQLVRNLIGHQPKPLIQENQDIYSVMPVKVKPVLDKVRHLNSELISEVSQKIQDHLVDLQTRAALGHLQNVASIPRLYRRTNRTPPKEASNYMVEAVGLVLTFHRKFDESVKSAELEQVLEEIVTKITTKYLGMVQEVLRSVCKTEESLRRLKSRNVLSSNEGSSLSNSDNASDETKIREQIRLDICYFVEKLRPLAKVESRIAMEELSLQTS